MLLRNHLIILAILIAAVAKGQQIIPLYSGTIPNSKPNKVKEDSLIWNSRFGGFKNVTTPTLEIYLPDASINTGEAVIICPGGGYAMEVYQDEGINIAKTFQKNGIAGIILKYRLPSDAIMQNKSIGPLQDAQQAIKQVRQLAEDWHIKSNKIGIMGFSAGGHLAASAGTHFDSSYIPNKEGISLRPDFMILVYPVISMSDALTHTSSRRFLLGDAPSPENIRLFSDELQVTPKTPPTWITHTGDDAVVTVNNSLVFYQALLAHQVPAEMHLYPKGDHGFVLAIPADQWMAPVVNWIRKRND